MILFSSMAALLKAPWINIIVIVEEATGNRHINIVRGNLKAGIFADPCQIAANGSATDRMHDLIQDLCPSQTLLLELLVMASRLSREKIND
jgi:hypothetical protein